MLKEEKELVEFLYDLSPDMGWRSNAYSKVDSLVRAVREDCAKVLESNKHVVCRTGASCDECKVMDKLSAAIRGKK